MKTISKKRLALFAASLLFGVWLGYLTAAAFGGGGLSAMFAFAGVILAGVVLLVYGFIALLLAKQPDGTGGPAARVTISAAGCFVAGMGGGWVGATVALAPAVLV